MCRGASSSASSLAYRTGPPNSQRPGKLGTDRPTRGVVGMPSSQHPPPRKRNRTSVRPRGLWACRHAQKPLTLQQGGFRGGTFPSHRSIGVFAGGVMARAYNSGLILDCHHSLLRTVCSEPGHRCQFLTHPCFQRGGPCQRVSLLGATAVSHHREALPRLSHV